MLKSLRVPERLFQIASWLLSLFFASFLIGLGGKIVGDLPGVDQSLTIEQFMNPAQVARSHAVRDSLARVGRDRQQERERAALRLAAASNGYRSSRASFDAWIATRTATTDPAQDPEVLDRTRQLDKLKSDERAAQADVERLDAQLLSVQQATDANQRLSNDQEAAASGRFEAARNRQQLRVFGIRLLITLPLLLIAGWMVMRKRMSEYWPLARGFVIFALFVFFVELVPYLPSYGGYVRYGVGVVVTAIAGVYLIRAMRAYVARREEAQRRSESERRQAIGYEEAIKRVSTGVCPGCERAIATTGTGAQANFCVHCGMTLFDQCRSCTTRKNAFFHFCPACGVETDALAPA